MRNALKFALWDYWSEETMYVALSYLSYLWDLGFEGAKRWGDALKSPFGVAMQATSGGGDNFNGEGGGVEGSYYVKMLH